MQGGIQILEEKGGSQNIDVAVPLSRRNNNKKSQRAFSRLGQRVSTNVFNQSLNFFQEAGKHWR